MPSIANDLVRRQLRRVSERQADQFRAPARVTRIDCLGPKGPALRFTGSPAANFNPLVIRGFVVDVRDEDPVQTPFPHSVDHHRVTRSYAVPSGGSNQVALSDHFGTLSHRLFLLAALDEISVHDRNERAPRGETEWSLQGDTTRYR